MNTGPILSLALAPAVICLFFFLAARRNECAARRRLLETGREIASLRRALARTENEKERLESVIAASGHGLASFDRHGRLALANRAADPFLVGGRTGSRGRKFWEAITHERLVEMCRAAFEEKKESRAEIEMLASGRVYLFTVRPDAEGFHLSAEDRTERFRAEKMRRDFTAAASHEIRSPLSILSGALETIEDQVPTEAKPFFEIAGNQVTRLAALAGDLLTLTEAESEKALYRFEALDAGSYCRSFAPFYEEPARKAGITIGWDIPASLPPVRADRRRVGQVLGNLLDNALRFTDRGGRITVSAEESGKVVRFTVRDTGTGIPAADLSRIFERFYRVDRGRARQTGGTGLGLAIVKHIVESHGGTVSVESEPGRGSSFRFTLPVART